MPAICSLAVAAATIALTRVGQAAADVELLVTSYHTDQHCDTTPEVVTMDFAYDPGVASAYTPPTVLSSYTGLSRFLSTSSATTVEATSSCDADGECVEVSYGYYSKSECTTNQYKYADSAFSGSGGMAQQYLMVETYEGTNCETLSKINATLTGGGCQFASENASSSATLFDNGTAVFKMYDKGRCGGNETVYAVNSKVLTNNSCYDGYLKFYTNYNFLSGSNGSSSGNDSSGSFVNDIVATPSPKPSTSALTESSGLSTGVVAGVVVAALVLVVCIAAFGCKRWRRKRLESDDNTQGEQYTTYTSSNSQDSQEQAPHGLGGLWDDEAIATARIPREKVIVQQQIGRGAYGEVYVGTYNDQLVAIKMLRPENRKRVAHLNEFLTEVKMTATLDHPRIVRLIGVAWDSLTDLCAVSEYVQGGDLRTLLSKFKQQQHSVGFDHDKVKIALHVAHALTYLHSLAPPVIHRDLKSSNILLGNDLDAKLTDFGISRERIARTMTAGVGTAMWMAPELMLSGRYDDKVDMFSFGVVLSELDSHSLPYSRAKDTGMSETAILQKVATGELRVEFSERAVKSVVQLGLACVSIKSKDRPTAAEALYRLQVILAEEM